MIVDGYISTETERIVTRMEVVGATVTWMTFTYERPVTVEEVMSNSTYMRSFHSCGLFGQGVLSEDGHTVTFVRLIKVANSLPKEKNP